MFQGKIWPIFLPTILLLEENPLMLFKSANWYAKLWTLDKVSGNPAA